MKKFKLWDYAVLKTCVALIGIIIGDYISAFVKQNLWYFIIVAAVLYIYMLIKVFKK